MPRLLIVYAAICAAAILSQQLQPGQIALYGPLKALATGWLIAWACGRGQPGDPRRLALLIGLGLSWVGDVALLWPEQGFLPGLVAFLLAHLAYLVAFTRGGVRLLGSPLAAVAYAGVAALVLSRLWPGIPSGLKLPVVVYVLALAAMAAQTAAAWRHAVQRAAAADDQKRLGRAALGGALFLASDALLATNRFAMPLPAAGVWILSTYWAAQALLAASLPPRPAADPGPAATAGGEVR